MSVTTTMLRGYILAPDGFVDGSVAFDGARIASIAGTPVDEGRVRDGSQPIVLPGFIDLHVHGGAGRDIMEGGDAALRVAALHARHGTTSLLATTMTAPQEDLDAAFAAMAECARRHEAGERGGARVLGVHLEGPYINTAKLGAQPDFARPLAMDELMRLHRMAPIRLVTLAPEIPENMDTIAALTEAGFRVQLGHTAGSYEDAVAALQKGATGFTHLFNAMTGLHHRAPGMAGAALAHARYAEIIPDLLHVHPGAIRAALRAIPCLYCVTDSTAAAGMPEGEYRLGQNTVYKCMNGVRLADGTLAGSSLTMDQALRNLVDALGLDLADASRRMSTHAADHIGETARGRLAVGAFADAVVLDRDLNLLDVYVEGVAIEHAHAG